MKNHRQSQKRTRRFGIPVLVLCAAAVCAVLLLLLRGKDSAPLREGELYISEIQTAPGNTPNADGLCCDWIELENRGGSELALSGYGLSDAPGEPKFVFPADTVLPAGEYLVVYCAGKEAEGSELYATFGLRKAGGERVTLTAPGGTVIDSVETIPAEAGKSLTRQADGSLLLCDAPTPGFSNDEAGMAALQTQTAHELQITEIGANVPQLRDAQGISHDYIEVRNISEEPLCLDGYGLSDSQAGRKVAFPAGTVLQAGEYCAVECDATADENAQPFSLSKRGGEVVYLFDASGACIDKAVSRAVPKGHAWCLIEGEWQDCTVPTPGYPNGAEGLTLLAQDRQSVCEGLEVTEVMVAADSSTADWIELTNAGTKPVCLLGWYVADGEEEGSWPLPDTVLAPGEVLMLYAVGLDGYGKNYYTDFGLSAGETVVLISPAGEVVSRIPCPESTEPRTLQLNPDGSYQLAEPTPGA